MPKFPPYILMVDDPKKAAENRARVAQHRRQEREGTLPEDDFWAQLDRTVAHTPNDQPLPAKLPGGYDLKTGHDETYRIHAP